MKGFLKNQRGVVLIMSALLLMVLLGFAALATEAGRWYLVRSELSKAADAAAMAGVKNISNPNVTVETIAKDIGDENFSTGELGTPGSGEGSISFTTTKSGNNKIQVVGQVSAIAFLARLFGIEQVSVSSSGVAQIKEVEIMMVLDRSGSMVGTPLADLQTAAKRFLDFFEETQGRDKVGLITFATGVKVNFGLENNFVDPINGEINSISVLPQGTPGDRDTNMEDAIDQADGPGGFTDQTSFPADERKQQFMIFFSDGKATAFRGTFTRNGTSYDAVVPDPGDVDWFYGLHDPNTGNPIAGVDMCKECLICNLIPCVKFQPTGNGTSNTTKWHVFIDRPVPGYSPNDNIPEDKLKNYVIDTARQMAIDHAQELKNKYIKIYTIGLGSVDTSLLGAIASGKDFENYTPTSDQLEAIFQAIAKEIKLRLVE